MPGLIFNDTTGWFQGDSSWGTPLAENETLDNKPRSQIAKVTAVKSFTVSKNVLGVCDAKHYFKFFAMKTTWKVVFQIFFPFYVQVAIRCDISDKMLSVCCKRILTTLKGKQNKAKYWESRETHKCFTQAQRITASFSFDLGLSVCFSDTGKQHPCSRPPSEWLFYCSCLPGRKHPSFLWNDNPNWDMLVNCGVKLKNADWFRVIFPHSLIILRTEALLSIAKACLEQVCLEHDVTSYRHNW